jgi:putative NIF3 family GTP cyclohydrolase 1 type 2
LTTAENRQELDRILTEIDRLPADAAPHPDSTGLAEALAEIDRVLAAMDAREAVA